MSDPLTATTSSSSHSGRAGDTLPILMYHSISPVATQRFRRFAMHPTDFASHMAFLADVGFQTFTVTEAMAARDRREQLPEHAVVLTFDDGFADFHSTALPILREHHLRATLYVITGYIGTNGRYLADCNEQYRRMIGWSQLREAADEGVEIGSHSHTHPQLDRLNSTRLADEVGRPKAILEDRLGQSVSSFAFPFGYRNETTRRAVAAAGYETACGVDDLPARTGGNPLALTRLTVNAGTSVEQLGRLLRWRPGPVSVAARPIKRVLWRAARRGIRVQPQWQDPAS